jgi:hypothetical protein
VYAKFKVQESPFTNETSRVELRKTDTEFSGEELRLISLLLEAMGVDSAELDVLRDATTGQIHVVDVNPTPWGPPAGLREPMRSSAIAACARAYRSAVVHAPGRPVTV